MSAPPMIIRQDLDTAVDGDSIAAESGAALIAATLLDIPTRKSSYQGLEHFQAALRHGAVPVGSVEFVREGMRLAALCEPQPMSYPLELDQFLGRNVDIVTILDIQSTLFVKPVKTKLFTGFVYRPGAPASALSQHDAEQSSVLRNLPASTAVWTSEQVEFVSEWRYYVHDARIIGAARYDQDGSPGARAPDMDVVHAAVRRMSSSLNCPAAYGLDMGVLADGRTVLVEVNDAWALGLYGRALDAKAYLGMLIARWAQIRGSQIASGTAPEACRRAA